MAATAWLSRVLPATPDESGQALASGRPHACDRSILLALLGAARYDLARRNAPDELGWLIVGLAVLCATYAYYTLGLSKLTGISALSAAFAVA